MDRSQLLNDNEASLRLALDGRQSTIWTALPCIVQKVNLIVMTLEAQPAIQGTVQMEDNSIQSVNLPLLVDVPICFPSAGGFLLTLPIAVGDEVLVVFASRCIDSWWQSGGVGRPMELRMHDLSDGFAIPGPRSVPNVALNISSTAAQLRNLAGTTYLEIRSDGKVKAVSPTEIDLQAPLVKVTGDLQVTGTIQGTEVTAGLIPLSTHLHVGVTPGSGTSGGPTP